MTALFALLVVLAVSLLITRIATVALVNTGLSRESARFQARSAFSGSGFTTAEAEHVVRHPVRRRIIMLLMLLGNAGIVTVISSLILSFVGSPGVGQTVERAVVLGLGLVLLWGVATSRWIDRHLSRLIEAALRRWTQLDVADYAGLLHLARGYRVVEMAIEEGDWLAGQKLDELELSREGILVLGVERDQRYLGTPRGRTRLLAGDRLVLYGSSDGLAELDRRRAGPSGEEAHRQAVDRQRSVAAREEAGADEPPSGAHDEPSDEAAGVDRESTAPR